MTSGGLHLHFGIIQENEIKSMFFISSQIFRKHRKRYLCSGVLVIWYSECVTILTGSVSVHTEEVGWRFPFFPRKNE